jgi:hypothetical protein
MLLILIPAIAVAVLLPLRIVVDGIRKEARTGKTLTGVKAWVWNKDVHIWVEAPYAISIGILCLMLFITGMSHLSYITMPTECLSAQQTIDDARERVMNMTKNPYEDAAILNTVIVLNKQLAFARFWNNSPWTSWIVPDKIVNIPYIR